MQLLTSHLMEAFSRASIYMVINRYIGVSGGYLGDFTYRSHAEFYPEFCDLDINPDDLPGTTRVRFLAIVERSDPATQARILRGVLEKYPVGSSELRTPERAAEIQRLIRQLEAGCGVPSMTPAASSRIVVRAIDDAEALLRTTGAPSGADRMHTAFHGFLKVVCNRAGIKYSAEPSITELYKALRQHHPAFTDLGTHGEAVDRILKSFASAVDSLNTLRNRASVAHPNDDILPREEAYLYVNAVRTLMAYLDTKLLPAEAEPSHVLDAQRTRASDG